MSPELKTDISAFYEMDGNSRMCPGMKETVTVRDRNCDSVKHQKRLVLTNLKELHAAWNELHPDKKVGFSTFATLRPKWCVLAGASGTHSVCVCKYHQNPKLMVEACLKCDVHDLIRYCVCSDECESCMMGQCKDCRDVRESLITSASVMILRILRRSLISSGSAQIEHSW